MKHPCGALPITGLTLTTYYCHQHGAWWARMDTYRESGSESVPVGTVAAQFGPFDQADDVLDTLSAWLAAAVQPSGVQLVGIVRISSDPTSAEPVPDIEGSCEACDQLDDPDLDHLEL